MLAAHRGSLPPLQALSKHLPPSPHPPRPRQLNDWYALMNAVPAMGLCLYGFLTPSLTGSLCFGAGLGITLFGIRCAAGRAAAAARGAEPLQLPQRTQMTLPTPPSHPPTQPPTHPPTHPPAPPPAAPPPRPRSYMFVHDGLVHRRFPVGPIAELPYMKRVMVAHKLHHSEKYGGVPYGLFLGAQVGAGAGGGGAAGAGAGAGASLSTGWPLGWAQREQPSRGLTAGVALRARAPQGGGTARRGGARAGGAAARLVPDRYCRRAAAVLHLLPPPFLTRPGAGGHRCRAGAGPPGGGARRAEADDARRALVTRGPRPRAPRPWAAPAPARLPAPARVHFILPRTA
jgi:hypothetical protein